MLGSTGKNIDWNEMDWITILEKIAVPRPCHRETLGQVATYIQELLTSWGIPFATQAFSLRPHAMMLWGVGVVILAVLFFLLILKKQPLLATIPFLILPLFVFMEVEYSKPILSSVIETPAENIVARFESPTPERELVFAAHYDSKTDLWDHIERARIAKLFAPSLAFGLVLIIWTFLANHLKAFKAKRYHLLSVLGAAVFVVYYGFVFSWWGGYVFMSPKNDSPGAVDDGGAVVTLLAISKHIHDGQVAIGNSNVTILLTAGEEVGLQGATHFVTERFGERQSGLDLPVFLVNLELVGQNGNMIYWEKTGVLSRFHEADPRLVKRLDSVWQKISGKRMDSRPSISDDSKIFGDAGIPLVTVGHSGLPGRGLGDFHSVHDNMERVNPENLLLMVKTLERFIQSYAPGSGGNTG